MRSPYFRFIASNQPFSRACSPAESPPGVLTRSSEKSVWLRLVDGIHQPVAGPAGAARQRQSQCNRGQKGPFVGQGHHGRSLSSG
jgi:hypothetical protein